MSDKSLPGWPRLLSRQLAASYCGISVNHFMRTVPVKPRNLGSRVVWDRAELDEWIDAGLTTAGNSDPDPWEAGMTELCSSGSKV